MKRSLIRALAVTALLLTLILSLASCSTDGKIPDGWVLISDGDLDGFLLYVPEEYTSGRESGIPIAYRADLDPTSISGYLVTSDAADIPTYYEAERLKLSETLDNYTPVGEPQAITVADRDAHVYVASFTKGEGDALENYKMMQVLVPKGATPADGICILTYIGKTDENEATGTVGYDDNMESFERVLQLFAFPESRGEVTDKAPITENAPDGMQLSSTPDISNYYLYIPLSWKVDMTTGMSSAYFPDDRTSITVTSVYPEGLATVADYEETRFGRFADFYDTVERVGEYKSVTVDGFTAFRYDYMGTLDGVTYRFCQIHILKQSGSRKGLYTIQLSSPSETADAANALFDFHADTLDQILEAFHFS